ncbi:methyltransferase [Nonomuraea sp. PA05]|uniref:50S ribosomal protein L11 methyltransferase n=1 Tax=Nonomuraea sp. PA05 TaxID=2604466 RepID=UPI0011D4CAAB|nr:50S ribosomal protein L11 methyltransferase [Nonomuraea sp. PA05]TYB47636.1 methyltransferase [Nonomuraea sp. PA05]
MRSSLEHWGNVGRELRASPGVHRPSTFSAFLASTMDDTRDQVVVDAGCGAGLVTLAALTAGARHVIAQDQDGAALADTARNVVKLLGHEARERLTLWEADWRLLAPMNAQLLAVNPPQRPAALLPDVPPDQRHLHNGGGLDGLDAIRLILAHSSAGRVRTTAAAVLDSTALRDPSWTEPHLLAHLDLLFDPAWRSVLPSLRGRVNIWEFTRTRLPSGHLVAP